MLIDENGWGSTSVPSEIFRDLLDAEQIKHPHVDLNEQEVQWVGEVDWIYRTRFVPENAYQKQEKAVLVFEGLDTFARVYLNRKLILETEVPFPTSDIDAEYVPRAPRGCYKLPSLRRKRIVHNI